MRWPWNDDMPATACLAWWLGLMVVLLTGLGVVELFRLAVVNW